MLRGLKAAVVSRAKAGLGGRKLLFLVWLVTAMVASRAQNSTPAAPAQRLAISTAEDSGSNRLDLCHARQLDLSCLRPASRARICRHRVYGAEAMDPAKLPAHSRADGRRRSIKLPAMAKRGASLRL